jgi:hypothetical protein
MLLVWLPLSSVVCFFMPWHSHLWEQLVPLDHAAAHVDACAPDYRKHHSRWRLPVLPAFYGIFAGSFLLTTWFARMLGCLLVAWCPLEILEWPPFLCYRLYRKAPPWLLWKILPLGLHCVDVYFEFYPETRDFLEFCFKTEDWILSKLHCTIVP